MTNVVDVGAAELPLSLDVEQGVLAALDDTPVARVYRASCNFLISSGTLAN
jgi:hypothetical protein